MANKNAEFPKIRIESELHDKIVRTLKDLNQNDIGMELTIPQFRRMAYLYFLKKIEYDKKLDLSFNL